MLTLIWDHFRIQTIRGKEKINRLIPLTAFCGSLFFDLSPMHFRIFHTFSTHYAQSPQMSVLCMVEGGSKAS